MTGEIWIPAAAEKAHQEEKSSLGRRSGGTDEGLQPRLHRRRHRRHRAIARNPPAG